MALLRDMLQVEQPEEFIKFEEKVTESECVAQLMKM